LLRNFFELEVLSFSQWVVVFGASLFMFIIIEISKVIFRSYLKTHSEAT